ncbi:MAG TPA: hypothetical protein PKA28_11085 [Methylomusa anaerophila]|uniref:Uncharacterized protein n=1 Tax=Methylomusa anaerophila TaxID=1930071 RepID=A0A348AJ54_9FIRM|nr:hypothetical protein [Methylomusa anaerophila]BBB91102.1 hypothetical protein MAMMFC1_01771 [Methylomusa anaerophila]HML88979.1 hypothetical protein [Methylomusa anaerophila]
MRRTFAIMKDTVAAIKAAELGVTVLVGAVRSTQVLPNTAELTDIVEMLMMR